MSVCVKTESAFSLLLISLFGSSKVESNPVETTETTTPVFMKQQWKPLEVDETDRALWNLM